MSVYTLTKNIVEELPKLLNKAEKTAIKKIAERTSTINPVYFTDEYLLEVVNETTIDEVPVEEILNNVYFKAYAISTEILNTNDEKVFRKFIIQLLKVHREIYSRNIDVSKLMSEEKMVERFENEPSALVVFLLLTLANEIINKI